MTTLRGGYDEVEEAQVVNTPTGAAAHVMQMLAMWTGLALVVVLALLALRLGVQMAEANTANNFVEFIYDVSGPLVQPFDDIARTRSVSGGGFFEPATAFAMGVYTVSGLLVIAILMTVAAGALPGAVVRRRRSVRDELQ